MMANIEGNDMTFSHAATIGCITNPIPRSYLTKQLFWLIDVKSEELHVWEPFGAFRISGSSSGVVCREAVLKPQYALHH